MAFRTLEVTLISAKDLKKVNIFTKMEVYAIASISGGDPRARHRTAVDRNGGRSPTWNATLCFAIPAAALDPRLALHVLLRSERILGDRDVGEVFVPLMELLDSSSTASADATETKFVSYQVRRPTSGKPKGVLNLSYKVSDVTTPPAEAATATLVGQSDSTKGAESSKPVTAYPVPAAAAYSAPRAYPTAAVPYAAPPGYAAYGYAVPPGYGYGAPPPAAGYGYGYGAAPPPTAGYAARPAQPRTGNFGMGLGAGLLGGALGGLLIGDMMADAVAYDAGFNDAIDF
ncbi:Protein SRC2 [Ananas comosus]|uniref:Protein SRC2 n=1 Tax=Ananas comosus TaxID=4615 RepID=A0A199V667_ANACO|nr:Protein SRC2 [Ananas comosus]